MPKNRSEILTQFKLPIYTPHPVFPHLNTFNCINQWKGDLSASFPNFQLIIHSIDYLDSPPAQSAIPVQSLHFQQDTYRLWYQIDGSGILQNATQKTFGTARPGLLGVMDRGERHTYLHQRGLFTCFQMHFSIQPSLQAKCYWNSGIEGKTVLTEPERIVFENSIFLMFLALSDNKEPFGLAILPHMLEIIALLFQKGLIIIEETRFPKNKAKSLVTKAKNYMNANYSIMHHQNNLEKECGVDINYLNILFKNETGLTLYHYLTCVRMEHATYLLETSSDTISCIASKTGYPNANSFSRAFKRLKSLTPQEFRSTLYKSNNNK